MRLVSKLLLLLPFVVPAMAQDAASQIQAKIQSTQESLRTQPVTDPELSGLRTFAEEQLKAAAKLLNAGYVYASLENLGHAMDVLAGARCVADHKAEITSGGFPAYDAEWQKVSATLAASEREMRGTDWKNTPAVVRALSETAQAQVMPLLEGGRGFATAVQPNAGLFNAGQAQGEAAFARFCASLRFPGMANTPPRRSWLPELLALQDQTNAAFVPPQSIKLHPRFIQLNSALKLARDLDAARFYSGALYQYLEAVLDYGMLDAVPPDANGEAALKTAIRNAQTKLKSSGQDDSIAQLLLERAAAPVLQEGGAAPKADDWTSAQVIVDRVLPAYFAVLHSSPSPQAAPAKTIEITLVRWPYT